MSTKVKICGLKTEAALDAALAGGADYVGLVFFPPSPRSIDPAAASALAAKARGRAKIVALLVDPEDALIDAVVKAVGPTCCSCTAMRRPSARVAIRRRWDLPVIKAIKVATAADARHALNYRAMADSSCSTPARRRARRAPAATAPPSIGACSTGVKEHVPFILSGGLTPDNVAEAIRATRAAIVDVSSGVEIEPRRKGPRPHPALPSGGKGR